MDFKYSNLDEYVEASQQYVLYGGDGVANVQYKEGFWYTLDVFPPRYSKTKKQELMYCKSDVATGYRLFTLRELADANGRILRRFVSMDCRKLNDYLDNNYFFLFIDIDDLSGFCDKALVTYSEMVDLVANFKSLDFFEVYVRPSTSTDEKPWKFHLYVRCRDPFYYRVPVGGGKHRRERENSLVLSENKMTEKFIKTFIAAFPEFFQSHQFAKVDTALYSIHQCLQGAPATDIVKVTRSVLPDTVIGRIPTKETKKDIYYEVPSEFRNPQPYPCTSSMRFKAWGITLLPKSFDPRLPSQKVHSDYRVGDGLRRRFACKLACDLWVAVHFNLTYYPEFAERYDADRLYRWVMSEVYVGADMEGANEDRIKASVRHMIKQMDSDNRSVEQIIAEDYASTVKYDENGKMIADPYKIMHPNRTSHDHVFAVIERLQESCLIDKKRCLKVRGAELEKVLADFHISRQTLTKHGIRCNHKSTKKPRSDKGKQRAVHSVWGEYVDLCRRDVDGRVVVPLDVGALPRFRKFASRHEIRYVSSSLPLNDPLCISRVVDMPKEAPWVDPWPPEDVA